MLVALTLLVKSPDLFNARNMASGADIAERPPQVAVSELPLLHESKLTKQTSEPCAFQAESTRVCCVCPWGKQPMPRQFAQTGLPSAGVPFVLLYVVLYYTMSGYMWHVLVACPGPPATVATPLMASWPVTAFFGPVTDRAEVTVCRQSRMFPKPWTPKP